jgi:hypothetical protein
MAFSQLCQAIQKMVVDAVDIPIVLATDFEGLVGEAVDLFHTETVISKSAKDGPPAGGAAVEGEETIVPVYGKTFHN